eukprot:CAMPEP_0197000468 /NCGR_PEP_ID=MMETSP1380-20130617/5401_1 /TAXON_ID=5936 /ORGANISM="Euplotes crassus, Strain CT5" /LENGTH=209 /DNA_ID=CAMNT_0042417771 /DNA_START=1275 /DNA_END=1901 /DNA_ORIENTATION=-
MIQAKTKSGRDVICEEFGRILSTEQNSKLLALSNTIVTYSTNSDLMQVFNITNYNTKSSNIEGITMRKMNIRDEIVNSRNQLMISISENKNKLILIDIIYSKYFEEPWYITYLGNKGLVFTVIIMIIIAYQIIKSRASPEDEESEQFKGIKKLLEKNNNNMNHHNAKLQEISKNLAFFGGQSSDKSPGGMKSNLRDPKSPMNSVAKNVR